MLFSPNLQKGFTLIELLVSVAIFVVMTALLVAKYGNFNQSVLLTDLSYDIALTIRTAQTYGVSVKLASTSGSFQYPYGVHFDAGSGNKTIQLFNDIYPAGNPDNQYESSQNELVNAYAIKQGAYVYGVCKATSGNTCSPQPSGTLDIIFKRPDPSAIICVAGACDGTVGEIQLKGPDGSTRTVIVLGNGQITVVNQ